MADAISQHPSIQVLHLDTEGGRFQEALEMADVARKHKLNTYVDRLCASAGVIVFLAGERRILRTDAHLGFHSAHVPGIPDSMANEKQIDALMSAGANTAFVERVINTPASTVWYPTSEELRNQGLVTKMSDGSGFSLGTAELAKYTESGLRKELLGNPLMNALWQRDPEIFGLAVAHAADSISTGTDVKTALKPMQDLLAESVSGAYTFPSDEALDARLDLVLETVGRNMYKDPKNTLLWLFQRATKAELPDYPENLDERFREVLLKSPQGHGRRALSSDGAAKANSLLLEISKKSNVELRSYTVPEDRLSQISLCEAWRDLVAAVAALPPGERHPVIRHLFFHGR